MLGRVAGARSRRPAAQAKDFHTPSSRYAGQLLLLFHESVTPPQLD